MSEPRSEEHHGEGEASPGEPAASLPPPPSDLARPRRGAARAAALVLAVLLALIVAGLALSPFWAPAIAPLFPWGATPSASAEEHAALAARVAAIERQPAPFGPGIDAIKSQLTALVGRVDRSVSAVDTRLTEIEKRPAPPQVDLEAVKSADSALAQRIAAVESAAGETKAALQQLSQRLDGIEAQSSSRAATEPLSCKTCSRRPLVSAARLPIL